MAYIANTAFEVRVSNHEFDSVANITGKFQNSTPADEICSAGFLCKRVSLIDNEGYSGIKKALSSRGRGSLRGFLELRRPWVPGSSPG